MKICLAITPLSILVLSCAVRGASFEALPAETHMASLIMDHDSQQRGEMVYQEVLNFIARAKAKDMAERAFFSHIDPDGYGPNFAAHQAGYALDFGAAPRSNSIESIGVRHQNRLKAEGAAQIVFDSWLESPGHRRHVLGEVDQFRNQTAYGVGYAFASEGPFGWSSHYFVFISANRDDEAKVTPFVTWKFETLSLAEMDHPLEDADEDGRDYLWEYTLGSDPKLADEGELYSFEYDQAHKQGVVTLHHRDSLDPNVEIIVETTGLSFGDRWTQEGIVREGNSFRGGDGADLVRLFRVRLEHSQFARLPVFR